MVQAPPKPRKRLTQAEALEQARRQIKEAEARPKPKRAANDDSAETRERERWVVLPKHLAAYVGEEAVICQGWLWTHRVDRLQATTDTQGIKHIPVKLVCLGPVDALDSNYKPKNKGLGQSTVEGTKLLISCLAPMQAVVVSICQGMRRFCHPLEAVLRRANMTI
jgi:hypothetical protein